LWDTTGEVFLLWDPTEEAFLHCGTQRKTFFSIVGYNGKKIYDAEWYFKILSACHCLQIQIWEKLATWTVKLIRGKN
jgi:hypothetical protein